jgi:hypothetical protein
VWYNVDRDFTLELLAEEILFRMWNMHRSFCCFADFVLEDVPDMSDEVVKKAMAWIIAEATIVKNPLCSWKDSNGLGVDTFPGRVVNCPASYTNNGFTCRRGSDDILARLKLPIVLVVIRIWGKCYYHQ